MKQTLLALALVLSAVSQANAADCSNVAKKAVEGALKSNGYLQKHGLTKYQVVTLTDSTVSQQTFSAIFSQGQKSDNYVRYNVEVLVENNKCHLVSKVELAGEE